MLDGVHEPPLDVRRDALGLVISADLGTLTEWIDEVLLEVGADIIEGMAIVIHLRSRMSKAQRAPF